MPAAAWFPPASLVAAQHKEKPSSAPPAMAAAAIKGIFIPAPPFLQKIRLCQAILVNILDPLGGQHGGVVLEMRVVVAVSFITGNVPQDLVEMLLCVADPVDRFVPEVEDPGPGN